MPQHNFDIVNLLDFSQSFTVSQLYAELKIMQILGGSFFVRYNQVGSAIKFSYKKREIS